MQNDKTFGKTLIKPALAIMHQHKKLYILPALSFIINMLVVLYVLSPLRHFFHLTGHMTAQEAEHLGLIYVLFLLAIFFTHIVSHFFNAILISCTKQYADGKKPCMRAGLRDTLKAFIPIYVWICYASTIGIVIGLAQPVFRKRESFMKMTQGLYWHCLIVLVQPILLFEKLWPIPLIRRSAELVTNTWGNPVYPRLGTGFVFSLWKLLAALPLIVALFTANAHIIAVCGALTLFGYLIVHLFSGSSHIIIRTALYFYAAEEMNDEITK